MWPNIFDPIIDKFFFFSINWNCHCQITRCIDRKYQFEIDSESRPPPNFLDSFNSMLKGNCCSSLIYLDIGALNNHVSSSISLWSGEKYRWKMIHRSHTMAGQCTTILMLSGWSRSKLFGWPSSPFVIGRFDAAADSRCTKLRVEFINHFLLK